MTDELMLDPARTTLLVTDYQVGLMHRLPDAPALLDATAHPDRDTHAFLTNTIFPRHASVIAVAELNDMWA
jgi:hypothetical protein